MVKRRRSKGRQFNAELLATELGIDPLQILFHFANGDWKKLGYDNECYFSESAKGETRLGYTITPAMRIEASQAICKYLYSAKQAVQVSGDLGIKIIVEDYVRKPKANG